MPTRQLDRFVQHLRRSLLLKDGGGMTDGKLLGQFIERHDEAAFEALVRRHGPMVLGVCQRLLGNSHDAEDAFQATFLVLVRRAASIGKRELVGNWLYGVAYRTAMEQRTKTARRQAREKQVTVMPDPAVQPQAVWQELRPLLDEELKRLPDKYRVPVVLCDLEGRTRKEVAHQLRIPEGTLSSRLATGRRTLAERLTRRGLALSGGSLATVLSQSVVSASVSASLVGSTVKAGLLIAAGKTAIGVISVEVVALTKGVLKAMLMGKLRMVTGALIGAGVAGVAAIGASYQTAAPKPTQPSEARQVAQNRDVPKKPAEKRQPPHVPPQGMGFWQERATLMGHSDQVNAVVFSPDGKTLASGGQDFTVVLWDLVTGKGRATLRGHKEPISCVSFSPDGKLLASGGFGGTDPEKGANVGQVKLWDSSTGKERATFKLRELGGPVSAVAFSPDGKLLAASGDLGQNPSPFDEDTGDGIGIVMVWEVATGKERATLREKRITFDSDVAFPPITSVAFSPDGKTLATAYHNTAKLWDWANQKQILSLKQSENKAENKVALAEDKVVPMFLRVAFSPDGKTLATIHSIAGVQLWDAKNGELRITLDKRKERFHSGIVFSADGKTLATANHFSQEKDNFYESSGEVDVWDINTGKLLASLPTTTLVSSVTLSPDGGMLAAGCRGNVKVPTKPPSAEDFAAGKVEIGDKRGIVKVWELKRQPHSTK